MLTALRALAHAHRKGARHRVWSEVMIWSGFQGRGWFCTCGHQFWPAGTPHPHGSWRNDPIRREPPWERRW